MHKSTILMIEGALWRSHNITLNFKTFSAPSIADDDAVPHHNTSQNKILYRAFQKKSVP